MALLFPVFGVACAVPDHFVAVEHFRHVLKRLPAGVACLGGVCVGVEVLGEDEVAAVAGGVGRLELALEVEQAATLVKLLRAVAELARCDAGIVADEGVARGGVGIVGEHIVHVCAGVDGGACLEVAHWIHVGGAGEAVGDSPAVGHSLLDFVVEAREGVDRGSYESGGARGWSRSWSIRRRA